MVGFKVYSEKSKLNFLEKILTTIFSAFPDITPQNSNSKESYHGLFPLEQLLEQKSQTLNAQTSTFRATKVEDGISYCLKRVHGKGTRNIKLGWGTR